MVISVVSSHSIRRMYHPTRIFGLIYIILYVIFCSYIFNQQVTDMAKDQDLDDAPTIINNEASPPHVGNISASFDVLRSPETKENKQCISAALVVFGVPKEFQSIWKAYLKNIVTRNPHITFKAHMHMYSDLHEHPFSNVRSNEKNAKLESPDSIQAILDKGPIPANLITSPQSRFDQTELSSRCEKILHKLLQI